MEQPPPPWAPSPPPPAAPPARPPPALVRAPSCLPLARAGGGAALLLQPSLSASMSWMREWVGEGEGGEEGEGGRAAPRAARGAPPTLPPAAGLPYFPSRDLDDQFYDQFFPASPTRAGGGRPGDAPAPAPPLFHAPSLLAGGGRLPSMGALTAGDMVAAAEEGEGGRSGPRARRAWRPAPPPAPRVPSHPPPPINKKKKKKKERAPPGEAGGAPAKAPPTSAFRGVTLHARSRRMEAHVWVSAYGMWEGWGAAGGGRVCGERGVGATPTPSTPRPPPSPPGKQLFVGSWTTEIAAAMAFDLVLLKTRARGGGRPRATNLPEESYAHLLPALAHADLDGLVLLLRAQASANAARPTLE